ncbi:hypothetical protein G6F35_001682 [Rhizopus arrhizus]|nr:hypothetical protein G6F21_004589 [Rhizopus arrhizus]KAG1231467.1 hypothetical protein G6F35_001682 [Rhizopus arrhizus]
MIQQQHQLFASHDHGDSKSTITSQQGTPEDELTSIHDASLLEQLESSHRETIPESYFVLLQLSLSIQVSMGLALVGCLQ